jgi:thiamine phosphate synthase YjbQ (UPF0047 family)
MLGEWHGVFSPKGELEAVEHSADQAYASAVALSPDRNRPNRTVRMVLVAPSLHEFLLMVANAALVVYHNHDEKSLAANAQLQKDLAGAILEKVPMSGDYWHAAHATGLRSKVAHDILSVLAEVAINSQPKET